jgi:phosphate transport system substrate-binding protein
VTAFLAACSGGQTPPAGQASPALPGQGAAAATEGAAAIRSTARARRSLPDLFEVVLRVHQEPPDVRINYQPIGSGGGIRQLIAQTVSFGATDGPMTDEQLKSAPGPIVHLPTVLGAVVPVYNFPS